LAATIAIGLAFVPSALSNAPVTGATSTTDNPGWIGPGAYVNQECQQTVGVNCNQYLDKRDVWLSGLPTEASVGAGTYFFAVLVPGGQGNNSDANPNDGTLKNLSDKTADPYSAGALNGDGSTIPTGDDWTNRVFSVDGDGNITYGGTHGFDAANNKIQMFPYDDTTNQGGEYILAVCNLADANPDAEFKPGVDPSDCKYDAFKVQEGNVVPPAANLTASKTAAATYTRQYTWHIDKSANTDKVYTAGGADGSADYTVKVSHDAGSDSGWAVSGDITVTNPESFPVTVDIADSIPGGTCSVTNETGVVVAGPGSETRSYTCTFGSNPGSGTNTATITWAATSAYQGGSTTATEGFTFDDPTSLVDECVKVDDTNPAGPQGQNVCVGDANPTTISYTGTVSGEAGTCTDNKNTASFTTNDTGSEDSATATVTDCQGADLTVTKTATPSFDLKYKWSIDKSVSQTVPGTRTFDYKVSVSHDAGTASNWQVKGTITVYNPNDWQDITLTNLSDTLDSSGACVLDTAGPYVVAKSGLLTVGYTCATASASDTKNTATATWDGAAAHTPNGSASGSFDVAFANPNLIDECINVVDDNGTPGNTADDRNFGQVCVGGANPTEFTYSKTLTVADGQCVTVTNTATFTTNDTGATGSHSQTVTYCAPATIGYWKTHISKCAPGVKTGTGGCNNNGPFTVAYLSQSLGNYVVDTGAKALAVFDANNCSNASSSDGNATGCLAAQLLGAKLNVANGGPSCIAATIAAADAFLISNTSPAYHGPGFVYTLNTRAQAIALQVKLATYNTGGGCV
jgi:hypothetical protein